MHDAHWNRQDQETALYSLYNADHVLIYVGITHNVVKRRRQHARDKPWWPEVAHESVEWFPNRSDALIAEEKIIGSVWPKYNSRSRNNSTRMLVDYPNQLMSRIDAAAKRSGLSRAAWLRQVAEAAVAESEQRAEAGV